MEAEHEDRCAVRAARARMTVEKVFGERRDRDIDEAVTGISAGVRAEARIRLPSANGGKIAR